MDCPNPAQIRRLIREENKAKDFPEDDPKESCQSDGELSAKILLGRLRANSVSVSDDEAAAKPRAKGEKDRMATAEKEEEEEIPTEQDTECPRSLRIVGLKTVANMVRMMPQSVSSEGVSKKILDNSPHLRKLTDPGAALHEYMHTVSNKATTMATQDLETQSQDAEINAVKSNSFPICMNNMGAGMRPPHKTSVDETRLYEKLHNLN